MVLEVTFVITWFKFPLSKKKKTKLQRGKVTCRKPHSVDCKSMSIKDAQGCITEWY
jgi:hypothetical protein